MASHTESGLMSTIHCIVRGTVQGVGFRYWTKKKADTLGVAGSVCNLPDGSVEVFASAVESVLQSFIKDLHRGPAGAAVAEVVVSTVDTAKISSETFQIIR
jgi:acylphosphatase